MSSARSPSPIPRERLNGGSPNSDGSCLPSDQPPSSLNATGPNRLGQRGMASALVRVNGSSANLSQFLATCLLLEKQTEDLTALWCYQSFEWMSFFSVIYLAQWTSHLFLLLVLLAMYGLAAVRAEDLRSPLLRPIYMFLPEGHSCFGLCHEQQSALLYQSSAALLRLGSLLLWLLLIVSMPEHQDICVVPISNFVDKTCHDVPMWLSSGCGTFFAPKEYRNCVATSWMQYGYCNLLAAQCRNQALGKINLPISIVFNSGISLMSVLAPFLWLGCVLWLSVRKGFCIFNTPRASELTLAIREAEIDLSEDVEQYQVFIGPSLKRLMRLDLALTLIDIASDVLVFFVFAGASNWTLALLQVLILSSCGASTYGLLRKHLAGMDVLRELLKAYQSGVFTEDYLNLVLLERQGRCPLSLFLQLYGSMFVTSNALVAAIFSLGILSSLLSAVQGGFLHIHVDLDVAPWSLNV